MRIDALAILWCIYASAQTQVPSVKPDDKCSIAGTVVNLVSGEPVKRARLILMSIGQETAIPYVTTSDAAGHFLIDAVDAGRFSLMASRNGYSTQSYSPQGDPKHSATLTLEKGQKLKDLVFKLTPQGVISGRVLDEDGDPLSNVTVECMIIGYLQGKRQLIGQDGTNTNDLGEFRLPGLPEGKYVISAIYQVQDMRRIVQERPIGPARAGQAAEEGFVLTYYPHTSNPNSASPIEVSAGAQISGINMTLIRARTVRIQGHVSAGVPALSRRTVVSLYPREEMQSGMPRMDAMVDPQGRFQMQGVVSGSYVLYAGFMAEGKRYTARMPVEVRDSNIEGIELMLQPPAELRGRLVIEEKGDLKGATPSVWLQPKAGESGMGGGSAQVKDDLTFKIDNVSLGSYDLHTRGFPEGFYIKSIRMGQQDITETGVDLAEGAAAEELTVVLNPNGGIVEGSVQNAKEEPAAGAKVTLIPDAGHPSLRSFYKTTDTDQNGRFIIKGVAPGEYKIYAWEEMEEGAYEDPDFMKPHESRGETVSIKERSHETVQLKAISAEATANQNPAR